MDLLVHEPVANEAKLSIGNGRWDFVELESGGLIISELLIGDSPERSMYAAHADGAETPLELWELLSEGAEPPPNFLQEHHDKAKDRRVKDGLEFDDIALARWTHAYYNASGCSLETDGSAFDLLWQQRGWNTRWYYFGQYVNQVETSAVTTDRFTTHACFAGGIFSHTQGAHSLIYKIGSTGTSTATVASRTAYYNNNNGWIRSMFEVYDEMRRWAGRRGADNHAASEQPFAPLGMMAP